MEVYPMQDADYVIIGAGVAGLTAAHELKKQEASVLVLEARERVGGRTWSGVLEGADVDWGGEWIGSGQPRVYGLIKGLGLRTFPTFDTGLKVLEIRGHISTYRGTIPSMAPWKLLQIQVAIWVMDAWANKLDIAAPWSHPNAARWDATTLEAVRKTFMWSADARATMDAAMRTIFGAECGELSMLHMLAYVHSAGSMNNLISTEGGFQHDRIAGGAQTISLALTKAIGTERVLLGQPAVAVTQDDTGVTVTSAKGTTYRAKRIIIAVPVPLGGRITFSPQLPALRQQLMNRSPMGAAVKCYVRYERPFWRERGFSGEAASGDGPISTTFDQCSEDGRAACLLAFVGGKFARTWHLRDPLDRKQIILDRLAAYFGDEARQPIAYQELDWCGEYWSGGAPIALFPTGTLSVHGPALREPIGRIHWAGSETARQCMGFIEGAVESGQRAAVEVLGVS
jgi:monoamine oxidase